MKYLWEFMEQATQILKARADKVTCSPFQKPYWFIDQVPWHGRILAPLAKFTHIIETKNLGGVVIPIGHRVNFDNKTTMGDFSNWVNSNCEEVMHFIWKWFWRSDGNGYSFPNSIYDYYGFYLGNNQDFNRSKSIGHLNYQAPFGVALIYLYLINGNNNEVRCGTRAVEMAQAWLTPIVGMNEGIMIFNNIGGAESFTWHHDGWQMHRANITQPWVYENEHVEDIGHGGVDITFPLVYNKYYWDIYPYLTGGNYFTNLHLARIKNTFSNRVFRFGTAYTYSATPDEPFNCNTFGHCQYMESNDGATELFQMNGKNWMDLYKFDNYPGSVGGNVYDILMNYYSRVEQYLVVNDANYGGILMKGLADMAYANAHKEGLGCFHEGPYDPGHDEESRGQNPQTFQINPNPANQTFEVRTKNQFEYLEILDLTGKIYFKSDTPLNLSTNDLQNGVYLVRVTFKNGEKDIQRLIVNK